MEIFTENFNFVPQLLSKAYKIDSEYNDGLFYPTYIGEGEYIVIGPDADEAGNLKFVYRISNEARLNYFDNNFPEFIESMINVLAATQSDLKLIQLNSQYEPYFILGLGAFQLDIPYPINKLDSSSKKVVFDITSYSWTNNSVMIVDEKNKQEVEYVIESVFFVYDLLCVMIAYSEQAPLELYIDDGFKKVLYIKPMPGLVRFIYDKKKYSFPKLAKKGKISEDIPLESMKNKITGYIYDDIEDDCYLSPLDGWSKITKLEFINFAV